MSNTGFTDTDGIRSIKLTGSIGETTEFFRYPMAKLKEIQIDMAATTYINSVGVKHWVQWAVKVPSTVKVILQKCPFLIVNQASMVVGFLPKNFIIESFFAPYLCPVCEGEFPIELKNSEHYARVTETTEHWVKLPEANCRKCADKPVLEPDFFVEKVFAFLKMR